MSWVFAGNHAELLLVGEDHVAQFFIAHVELAFELLDPFRLRLVRRVGAAGHVIDEERLVRRGRVQVAHVLDGLVRHVGGEVVVLPADPRENLGVIAEQVGRPLVGLAAHEAVEILEAHARRPLVEGAGRAVLEGSACCGSCRTTRWHSRCPCRIVPMVAFSTPMTES